MLDAITRCNEITQCSARNEITSARLDADDLSSILNKPDFSLADFERVLARRNIKIESLSAQRKEELSFLCDIHGRSIKQIFCDELIRWAEHYLSLIPIPDRTDGGDADVLIEIQKYAVRQLFFPDSGRGVTQDRWQMLKDCFQLHVKKVDSVNLKAMEFALEETEYTFGQEFRFCGSSTIIRWLAEDGVTQSLCEFQNGSLGNESVYENFTGAVNESFVPKIENGELVDASGEVIEREIYIYTLSACHELKLAKDREGFGCYHHSYLSGGLPVICAGEMAVDRGKVIGINNLSGHYRPSEQHLSRCMDILNDRKILDDDCCVMRMGIGIRHLIFNSDFMADLKKHESLRDMAVPVNPLGVSYRPGDKQIFPDWQQRANLTIRNFLLEQSRNVD